MLLSLNALECGALDLWGGLLFSYGGLYSHLSGLRSKPYLMSNEKGIKGKLTQLLKERDFSYAVEDAWIMTMPHYLGREGLNPLTIYFCYSKETLIVVVFEVLHPFTPSYLD
jgi:DUF1365 family protein